MYSKTLSLLPFDMTKDTSIGLSGSCATNNNDEFSDIEFILILESQDQLGKLSKLQNIVHKKRHSLGLDLTYVINNQQYDLEVYYHREISNKIREAIDNSLILPSQQMLLHKFHTTKIILDPNEKIKSIKENISYSDNYQKKSIEHCLSSLRYTNITIDFQRKDWLQYNLSLSNIIKTLYLIILSINKSFFSGYKHQRLVENKLNIFPKDWYERTSTIMSNPSQKSLFDLRNLAYDTIKLIPEEILIENNKPFMDSLRKTSIDLAIF